MSTPTVFLVVQPSLSHYREPFVRSLLNMGGVELQMAARYSEPKEVRDRDAVESASEELRRDVLRLSRNHIAGNFFWDKGMLWAVAQANPQLVILEGNFYNLTSWVVAILTRVRGKKVAFWGHGWKRSEDGIKLKLRRIFYRLAQAHYFYGDKAIDFAESVGFSRFTLHAVYNSMYTDDFLTAVSSGPPETIEKHATTATFIFSGRLTKRHQVDQVARAVLVLRQQHGLDARLIIVGDGSERDALRRIATIDKEAIQLVGAEYRAAVLRELHQQSDFSVSPGASGLNVIQSLGFGVPVIAAHSNKESGPEIESVRNGETGFLFKTGDFDQLVDTMLQAIHLSGEERQRMGETGRELVLDRYTASKHAEAMMSAIHDTLSSKKR